MGASVAILAAAGAAELVQPTGKWVVDFDDSQCVASRDYGSPDARLTLLFKAPVTGDVVQLAVAKAGAVGSKLAEQTEAKLSWGGATPKPVSVLTFNATSANRRLYLINLPTAEVIAGAQKDRLTIEGSGLRHSFALRALPDMMKVMDECVADLRRHWNYVPEPTSALQQPRAERKHPLLPVRAHFSLPRLFSSSDYPPDALRNDQGGTVAVVLLIDTDGKVADCTLTQTSGAAALDAQTCAIIRQRARYKPAKGLDGKPARDVDSARIRWIIP